MGVDAPGSTNTRFDGGAERSGPSRPATLAVALGSTSVLLAASVLGMVLAFAEKSPCRSGAWNFYAKQFQDACYTDIYPLYYGEGLSAGKVPYTGHPVEYPVLIGGAMQAAAWLVRNVSPAIRGREFFDVTVVLLAVCAVAGVLATARAAGPDRRAQALMVALSPALILSAFINWDLIALALTALGIAAWAGRRGVWAGVLLGLGVAAKFYPLVVFGPLLLLCLRAGQLREFAKTLAAAVLAWLAVDLPVMILAPSGWAYFYTFSKDRGADWGSIWYLFEHFNVPVLGNSQLSALNEMSAAFFAAACAAIAVLALAAPRRPRLPQLCFLVLAAFLMTNKVWSPQYVVWLVPLAVLARPRLWPYLLWQLAEVAYFFGIWGYLIFVYASEGNPVTGYAGISTGWYFAALLARFLAVALLAAYVVRDILYPERDVVRALGHDDPAGGVLDQAADQFRLRLARLGSAGLSGQVLLQPADIGGQAAVVIGGLADGGGARGADHAEQQRGVDGPGGDVGVPVPARAELIPRVVAVHQVDPAGDRLDPVHRVGEVDAGRVGVAGVQAEAHVRGVIGGRVGHRVPEPADRLERPGHGAVAARGVLDQHRQRPLDALHRLAPVLQAVGEVHARGDVPAVHDQALGPDGRGRLELLVEQLPAGNPDPVVAGGDVDDVRRVDVDVHAGRGEGVPDGRRIPAGYHRSLPALRIAEEELGRVRAAGDRLVQRVVNVEVGSDARHASEPSRPAAEPNGQAVKPPLDRPRASPTNPAMMPVTIRIRWLRVAEIICTYSPTRHATSPVAVAVMITAAPVWAFRMIMPRTKDMRPTKQGEDGQDVLDRMWLAVRVQDVLTRAGPDAACHGDHLLAVTAEHTISPDSLPPLRQRGIHRFSGGFPGPGRRRLAVRLPRTWDVG